MITVSPRPRDLVILAQDYADNTSIFKRVLRSRALSPFRRGAHAPVSAAASAAAKGISVGLGKIPVPIVNDLLGAAWSVTVSALRSKSHASKLGKPTVTPADKVKFELKELGGDVGDWDRYRWKIAHAIEQVNKQVDACNEMKSGPCDLWVKLLAKRLYLRKRITRLRVSIESVKAICDGALHWLDTVAANVGTNEMMTAPLFEKDVRQLKTYAGAHAECSPEFCMHSTKKWTSKTGVPTSDAALFLIKATGTATSAMAGEFDAVGSIDSAASG